jgi:hypothetical protein
MRTTSTVLSLIALVGIVSCSPVPVRPAPNAEYDPASGRLRLLSHDADGDGRLDTFIHMDGTRLIRIEHDPDGDGAIDRWDFFTEARTVDKVGLSSANDGIMDWQAFYAPDGSLMRVAISTKRNGTFDRVEVYQRDVLVRTEEDTNGDGRTDKWDTYRPLPNAGLGELPYAITSTAVDESGSGQPERRFIYGPNGSIARIEVRPNIGSDLFQ